jgi:hypothetical protein
MKSSGGPGRHAGVQREPARLACRLTGRLIAGRQGLSREHLAPSSRPHRDAVGDRVGQKLRHRLVLGGEAGKERVLGIAFQ